MCLVYLKIVARLGSEPLKFLYSEFLYNTQAVLTGTKRMCLTLQRNQRYFSNVGRDDFWHPSPTATLSDLGVQISRGWDDVPAAPIMFSPVTIALTALISDDRGWDSNLGCNPMHGWNPESLESLEGKKKNLVNSKFQPTSQVRSWCAAREKGSQWMLIHWNKNNFVSKNLFLLFFHVFFPRGFMPNHNHNTVSSRDRYLGLPWNSPTDA